jgi:hypothetical protein
MPINSSRLRTQLLVFLDVLKGILFCFKFKKKLFQRLGLKKRRVLFYVMCAAKNSEGCCDIAQQPMCQMGPP